MLLNPESGGYRPAKWSGTHPAGLIGAGAIGSFHLNQTLVYWETLDFSDIAHHMGSAGIVALLGVLAPWGNLSAASNVVMCGLPGGIIYAALWMQKLGFMSRLRYKNINRFFNVVLRYPVQLLAHWAGLLHLMRGVHPDMPVWLRALMVIGGSTHTANALYFADLVVGAAHIEAANARRAQKK